MSSVANIDFRVSDEEVIGAERNPCSARWAARRCYRLQPSQRLGGLIARIVGAGPPGGVGAKNGVGFHGGA